MPRQVVITGIGLVTPAGIGAEALFGAVAAGRSCLAPASRFDASNFQTSTVGEIKLVGGAGGSEFSATDYVTKHYRKAVKVMARDTEIAVAAAREGVRDASFQTRGTIEDGSGEPTYAGTRVGCHIGAGLLAAEAAEIAGAFNTARDDANPETVSLTKWGSGPEGGGGMGNLQPLWMLKYLPNMLACHVTIIHGCEGPSNTITCAEASGLLSLGESMRVIRRGKADACLSGGAESKINVLGLMRMQLAGRVNPDTGVVGEGGGILVLEDEESAKKRGVRIHAQLRGFGASHAEPPNLPITPGDTLSSDGIERSVLAAMRDAALGPGEIDAVFPMGLGVPAFDEAERAGLQRALGERYEKIPRVAFASLIGNAVAGHGAIQAGLAAWCLGTGRHPDASNAVPWNNVLVVSMGVGGSCAAAVLSKV